MLSFFITNLSYSIIDNIVFFSIIWLMYDLLKNGIQLTAQNKYVLALSFLSIGTLYFWFDLFSDKPFHLIQFFNSSNIFHGFHVSFTTVNSTLSFSRLNSIVALIYIVAFFIFLVKFTIQFASLRNLKNYSDFSNNNYFELLNNLGFNQKKDSFKIGLHHQITTPIVFGILEHIVLLPVSLCNHISQHELKMLLLHEYAHILRKDYLFNLLIELSGILLWFNPFVYLFKKELNLQREIACDEFVVNNTHNPIAYSKALIAVAENSTATYHPLSLAAHSNNSDLKKRIEIINGIHERSHQKTKQKFTLMASFLWIVSLFFFNAFHTTTINSNNHRNIKLVSINSNSIRNLNAAKIDLLYIKKLTKIKSKKRSVDDELSNKINNPIIEKELAFSDLLTQTKNWIKTHEDPLLFTGYNENNSLLSKDSTEEVLANKLLILSIVKNYQLKKAIFEQKVKNIANNAPNKNEAIDYLLNSSEWNEMVLYEKWVQEFLQRQ